VNTFWIHKCPGQLKVWSQVWGGQSIIHLKEQSPSRVSSVSRSAAREQSWRRERCPVRDRSSSKNCKQFWMDEFFKKIEISNKNPSETECWFTRVSISKPQDVWVAVVTAVLLAHGALDSDKHATNLLLVRKSPRKWRKCNLVSGDCFCGQRYELAMN